jgi:hypothetical protein
VKTGDLIRALAADNDARAMAPGQALGLASIPAIAIALGLQFAILGLRPHLFSLPRRAPNIVQNRSYDSARSAILSACVASR